MLRYDLDQLGWYNFEWLAQTVLKAEYGLLVESWGAHKDRGRDAFSASDLVSKKRSDTIQGPVIFQAKFVERANSLGADYWPNLKSSCQAEARLIAERVEKEIWDAPKTYALITNAPITADQRLEIIDLFAHLDSVVISMGGTDISAILDIFPEVARSFPQILTYRNLFSAIEHAQTKGVRERSQAAIAGAQDILPVFVPTVAYETAWDVLHKHHFVVLTGPPEMGKTSIGWMIAMAQLANDWQVIECRSPQDIFDLFDSGAKQLFLADDAFGRTEFKPTKGDEWEADLAKVLQKIDGRHWLIWTSRKHILERAIREMDLSGRASNYPAPAEVLVQADQLSQKEKALILYRHSVNAALESASKDLLKANLNTIVSDVHFTPERIRRFVKEALPVLAEKATKGTLKKQDVATEVELAMKRYTEMMEKSYSKLSSEHKWILTALLDEEKVTSSENLEAAFQHLYPGVSLTPIPRLLGELEESFLKKNSRSSYYVKDGEWRITRPIDWVHPSYRDLVIERLSIDRDMRLRYLQRGGIAAISLALSQTGGATGAREFPLLPDEESWAQLKETCSAFILQEGQDAIEALLEILESLEVKNEWLHKQYDLLLTQVCNSSLDVWRDGDTTISGKTLDRFFDVSSKSSFDIALPPLSTSWGELTSEVQSGWSDDGDETHAVLTEELLDWAEFIATARENDPRSLRKLGFPVQYEGLLDSIASKLKSEVTAGIDADDADSASSEAERLKVLSKALSILTSAVPELEDKFGDLPDRLRMQSDEYEDASYVMRQEEERASQSHLDEDAPRSVSSSAEVFNLSEIFSDL